MERIHARPQAGHEAVGRRPQQKATGTRRERQPDRITSIPSPPIYVYVCRGRCVLPRQDVNHRGLYEEVGPVEIADLRNPDSLAGALDRIARYHPKVTSRPGTAPGPVAAALGFKSWGSMIRKAKLYTVSIGTPTQIRRMLRDGAGLSAEARPAAELETLDPALVACALSQLAEDEA